MIKPSWVYIITIILTATVILALHLRNNNSIFYKIASRILGAPPDRGDGAFHIPLGLILMLILSAAIGLIIGLLVSRLR